MFLLVTLSAQCCHALVADLRFARCGHAPTVLLLGPSNPPLKINALLGPVVCHPPGLAAWTLSSQLSLNRPDILTLDLPLSLNRLGIWTLNPSLSLNRPGLWTLSSPLLFN